MKKNIRKINKCQKQEIANQDMKNESQEFPKECNWKSRYSKTIIIKFNKYQMHYLQNK